MQAVFESEKAIGKACSRCCEAAALHGYFLGLVSLLLGTLLLSGCNKKGGGGPPPQPPTEVEAERVSTAEVIETLGAVGTIQANESVDIKSEAEGVIKAIHFTE